MLISSKKFSTKIPKLPRGIEYQLRMSKSELCLDQNWMFVDREEEEEGCVCVCGVGEGVQSFRPFLETS